MTVPAAPAVTRGASTTTAINPKFHIHDETTPGDDADVRAVFTLGPAEI